MDQDFAKNGLPPNNKMRQYVKNRMVYHPSELPEHLMKAVHDAKMDTKHDHLNELLDNK